MAAASAFSSFAWDSATSNFSSATAACINGTNQAAAHRVQSVTQTARHLLLLELQLLLIELQLQHGNLDREHVL